MAKRDTRAEIVEAFKTSVLKTSLSQTRIAELISELGINRNTFYYHFASKYDVAMWVFRSQLAANLRREFPESQLINTSFSETGAGKTALPFYVHKETGARTLDAGEYFRVLIETVTDEADFYKKLFSVREPEFIQQVASMYEPMFNDDILFILDGRYMPEETRGLLADCCSHLVISMIEYYLAHKDAVPVLMERRLNPYWNMIHETLYGTIQEHPINRF